MNILKFKLLSNYKIFKKNFEINFRKNSVQAIVGENGSGKSILLEMILNAFIIINRKCIEPKYKNSYFDFQITYSFNISNNLISFFTYEQIKQIANQEIFICITLKEDNITFNIKTNDKKLLIENDLKALHLFLPEKIVAYSSGENETLSQEIYKYNINRFNKYYSNERIGRSGILEDKKFIYLDETYKYINIITNLLFNRRIYESIGIKNLNSFKYTLELIDYRNREIRLPDDKAYLINMLNELGQREDELRYLFDSYHINKIFKKFNDSKVFYELLEFLQDMNLYKIRRNTLKSNLYINAEDSKRKYTSYEKGRQVFRINGATVSIKGNEKIEITDLSDGEFQFCQVMGCIAIYNHSNTLFLLDEPDTHFNINWRTKFIDDILKIINYTSQVIFATHSLEILTDMNKKQIILFDNGEIKDIGIETFGTNTTLIAAEMFKKKSSISNIAYKRYNEYLNRIRQCDANELNGIEEEIRSTFGDSSERILLLYEIGKKRKS